MPEAMNHLRVLVVEDDATTSLMTLAQLGQIPCSVSLVENGLMAVKAWIAALRDGPFDLVLMDVNMPVMSGEKALQAIRRFERDLGDIRTPIVAFSADAGDPERTDQESQWLTMGFDAVLPKPCDRERLLQLVRQLTMQAAPTA